MPDISLQPALRAALRYNEITNASPYRISFAGKAKSGASFGFMQGDMAALQPIVISTFSDAMRAAAIPQSAIDSLVHRLSVHVVANPLSAAETNQVNAALLASSALVDAMDETQLAKVFEGLDTCISRAHAAGRELQPAAQFYFACWINMNGPPTKTLLWLDGQDPQLRDPVPPAPMVVDGQAARAYLAGTDFFVANPHNLLHLDQSVSAGLDVLNDAPEASLVADNSMAAADQAA